MLSMVSYCLHHAYQNDLAVQYWGWRGQSLHWLAVTFHASYIIKQTCWENAGLVTNRLRVRVPVGEAREFPYPE